MKRELERIEIPGAREAEERAWGVVERAALELLPVDARRTRLLRPLFVVVAIAVLAGAVASPPGRAVIDRVRRVVGVELAAPALFRLPAAGRLLVASDSGIWVVQADGSRRLLGAYREASWSPFGRFVVAARRNELATLEPDGTARWSLARPDVRFPRWAGGATDTRIAYFDRVGLHVVAGDGTGDRLIAPAEAGPAAWRPGPRRELAYISASEIRVQDADTGRVVWRANRGRAEDISALSWSTDGRRLLVLAPHELRVYDALGRVAAQDHPSAGTTNAAAEFVPGTHQVAVTRVHGAQSDVFLLRGKRLLFRGTGVFYGLAASPDGRWLLVAWPTADQWVFIRADGRKIVAVSNISAQFRSRTFPRVEGWCCGT